MKEAQEETKGKSSPSLPEKGHKGRLTLGELIKLKNWDLDDQFYVEEGEKGLLLHPSVHSLRRVYVEPTNTCNLGCRTCIRNAWEEPLGFMESSVFAGILESVESLNPGVEVFFGGFGEPLGHPDILDMVKAAHQAGARTELITNGVLLDEPMSRGLIEAGLDFLWVSLDGAKPETYLDVRLGNELPRIIENLKRLRRLRYSLYSRTPKLGIAFVAMKRNLADLPEVVTLGRKLGAKKFHISNVLPFTEDMKKEILYGHSVWKGSHRFEDFFLPRMDTHPEFLKAWGQMAFRADWTSLLKQDYLDFEESCPFVRKGTVSVRWDGEVSPCLPLLHAHENFLDETKRQIKPFFIGSLKNDSLLNLWSSDEYVKLRERLEIFDFSPCTQCNSCEMAEGNTEDCFGSPEPACGGCLWAQGFIRCP